MYQAAVVEDEVPVLEDIRNTLLEEFHHHGQMAAFDSFTRGESFLSMLNEHYHYDIVFLDIEMPGMDGISVCRRIRETAPETLVVFISNKEELVFQTFEVQPFRFIRKSQFRQQVPALVDALLAELKRRSPQILQIENGGDLFSFSIDRIVYVEAQRKECIIHTSASTDVLKPGVCEATAVRCRFMDLTARLSAYDFIQIHRSYIVNSHYIFHISRTTVRLTTREELPLSRGMADTVRKKFMEFSMR